MKCREKSCIYPAYDLSLCLYHLKMYSLPESLLGTSLVFIWSWECWGWMPSRHDEMERVRIQQNFRWDHGVKRLNPHPHPYVKKSIKRSERYQRDKKKPGFLMKDKERSRKYYYMHRVKILESKRLAYRGLI